MNNLEKLLEQYENGEKEPLYDMMCSVPFCSDCIVEPFCKVKENCEESRARWLLQEYVEPDSWEKVEADAAAGVISYWGCSRAACSECPAKIDGKKPHERFNTIGCEIAQQIELVRRCKALAGVE